MGHFWQQLSVNKWVVLGAAIWLQACDGVGYAFGSYSPAIKSALGYSQGQISVLGVAKDFGDSVGLVAGTICDLVPMWALFFIGATVNLLGYGYLWLIVAGHVPALPFPMVCILICVATNGESFLNTGVLIACVRNFPENRGGIVGILKGFTGLSGAIFTQVYVSVFAPQISSFVFLVAVGPFMVTIIAMFIVRPIPRVKTDAHEDEVNMSFIYSVCLAIAAYLMGVMVVQDLVDVSSLTAVFFLFGLLFLLATPLGVPLYRIATSTKQPDDEESSPLVSEPPKEVRRTASGHEIKADSKNTGRFDRSDLIEFSEMEDENMKPDVSDRVRRLRLMRMSSNLFKAVAEGAVKVRRRKGPRRGEDFYLSQALVKADFWLLFFILMVGAGSGLTLIDNMGQVGQAQGFDTPHIFVSLISIWSFLGRVASGWASEQIIRQYAAPRAIILAFAQAFMAIGLFMLAMTWPLSMYLGSLMVGFGYGCHWSIIPATLSELFGLKNFGTLYNVMTIALPVGSLVLSGMIAGPLYDREAAKQAQKTVGVHLATFADSFDDDSSTCEGTSCFQLSFLIMTAVCLVGVGLNLVLIKRTYRVYKSMYGKPKPQESAPAVSGPLPTLEESTEEEKEGASSSDH